MTETKRFNVTANEENWLEITDNGVNLNQLQVCDCLNNLHEDLEREKQKNKTLKVILACTKNQLKKICRELEL